MDSYDEGYEINGRRKRSNNSFLSILLVLIIVGALGYGLWYVVLSGQFNIFNDTSDTKNGYYVTLMVDDKEYLKIPVENGKITNLPVAPKKEGYTFSHWEYNGNKWDKDAKITESITIKAIYNKDEDKFVVTFNSDNGTTNTTVAVGKNEKVAEPKAPTKEGHTFIGWYNGDTKYDFDTIVTSDITLIAKWEKDPEATLYGDVNLDGVVDTNDRILIYGQIVGSHVLSKQQRANADVDLDGYITFWDLCLIDDATGLTRARLGVKLGSKDNQLYNGVILGTMYAVYDKFARQYDWFEMYLKNPNREEAPWIKKAMDMNKDGKIDNNDLTILQNLGNNLPTKANLYGDVNCDGVIDGKDVVSLGNYVYNINSSTDLITYQGSLNADVDGDGWIGINDLSILTKYNSGQKIVLGSSDNKLKKAMIGDFDLNDIVNQQDVDNFEKYLNNHPLYKLDIIDHKEAMDLNDDGILDSKDLDVLKVYLTYFGPGTREYIDI